MDKYMREQMLAAAKKLGIRTSPTPPGMTPAFISPDGKERYEIEGRLIDTSYYYGPWKKSKSK